MKKFTILLLCFMLIGLEATWAQSREITGKVTSSVDGQALPGVSVIVKGTKVGITTNVDGEFTLQVPEDATILELRFIGLATKEVALGTQTSFDITMDEDVVGIEEVVVTALGIKREVVALGYSATEISSEEITNAGTQSPLNALRGKVAGVNINSASGAPGSSTRINIRGYSSLTGSNEPLFVVDGVPRDNYAIVDEDLNGGVDFGNKLNDINPEDIESVTVLKGSASSALYGSRAGNGVILITTKSGQGLNDLKVSYSGNVSFDTPLRLPKYQNTYGQGFFGEPDLIENTSWGPKMDGEVRPWGFVVDNSQNIKPYAAQEDNVKDFFDTGVTHSHTLNIANGNGNSSYYLSYGYVNADGIMPTDADAYKRHTFLLKGSTSVKKIKVESQISYINKKSSFVPTGQDQSVMDNIMQVPRDMSIVDGKDYNDKFWNLDNYYSGYTLNPYYVLNEHGNEGNENAIAGNIVLSYNINSWLSTKLNAGGETSGTEIKQWRAITEVSRNDYNDDAGRVSVENYNRSSINTDLYLVGDKKFNKISVNGLIGHNLNQRETKFNESQVIGLDIPYFYHISNSSATPTLDYEYTKRRLIGLYGELGLSYDEWIFFNVKARNDWSSTLPEANNSYFYPATSLSFVFSRLIPKNNILTFGKLRLGYGQTGNDADPYQIYSVYGQGLHSDGYRDLTYPLPGNINGFEAGNIIGNLELEPELITEFEIGTDVRLFSDRLSLDFTYYDKTINNLIYPVPIPASSGFAFQVENIGEITNTGVEVLLSITPVRSTNFNWEISATYTKNNNKLVKLDDNGLLTQVDLGGTSRLNYVARPGEPIGSYYGEVPKYHNGMIIVDNSGLPVAADEYGIYGNSQYDWIGGLNNTFRYKNLLFSFTFDTKQGGLMYSRTAEMQYFAGTAPNTLYNDRQPFIIPNSILYDPETNTYSENTQPVTYGSNLHTYWGQDYGGGQFNRRFVIDKSFFKLREVSLSYSIPGKLTERIGIEQMRFSVFGRNLLLWTPEDNSFIDPELTTFGNNIEGDYGEFSATPTTRTVGFGLNVTF